MSNANAGCYDRDHHCRGFGDSFYFRMENKIDINGLKTEFSRIKEAFEIQYTEVCEENRILKKLCGRAADALASWHPYLEMAPEVEVELVKDLRKAAK